MLYHLQALRGLAASLVVLSHCADTLAQHGLMSPGVAARLGISGYFGVAAFFIISGFIIYRTSRRSFGDPRGASGFVLKRLIRIFPVYWIATALFVALSPHRADFTAADVLFSALLVPHVIASAGNMHPLVGQGWTLQYEILFYMIFALGLFFTRTIGTALIVAALAALVAAGSAIMPLSDMAEPLTIAAYWTRPIILLFAAGIGLGLLRERIGPAFSVPYPFMLMLMLVGLWFVYSLGAPLAASEQIRFPAVLAIWALCGVLVFVSIFGCSEEGIVREGGRGVRRCVLQRLSVPYFHFVGPAAPEAAGRQPGAVHRGRGDRGEPVRVRHVPAGGAADTADMPGDAVRRKMLHVGPPARRRGDRRPYIPPG